MVKLPPKVALMKICNRQNINSLAIKIASFESPILVKFEYIHVLSENNMTVVRIVTFVVLPGVFSLPLLARNNTRNRSKDG